MGEGGRSKGEGKGGMEEGGKNRGEVGYMYVYIFVSLI